MTLYERIPLTVKRLRDLEADLQLRLDTNTPPSVDTLAVWIAWVRAALVSLEQGR